MLRAKVWSGRTAAQRFTARMTPSKKTKQGRFMTEADAQKAGCKSAGSAAKGKAAPGPSKRQQFKRNHSTGSFNVCPTCTLFGSAMPFAFAMASYLFAVP